MLHLTLHLAHCARPAKAADYHVLAQRSLSTHTKREKVKANEQVRCEGMEACKSLKENSARST